MTHRGGISVEQQDADITAWMRGLAQRIVEWMERSRVKRQDLARIMGVSGARVTFLLNDPERTTERTIWLLSRSVPEFANAYIEYTDLLRSKLPSYRPPKGGHSKIKERLDTAQDLREIRKALDEAIRKLDSGET